MSVGVREVAVGFIRDLQKRISLVIYNKTIQWHIFNLSSYNWMNFCVYQIGVSRSFSELARAVAKCKDTQTLTSLD